MNEALQQPAKIPAPVGSHPTLWARLRGLPYFYAIVGILLLLSFSALFGEHFFDLKVQDGHLYGTPVDIIKQGSLTMLLALGMTLVIATAGVDLSVGSIMVVSGVVTARIVEAGAGNAPFALALVAGLSAALLCGVFNGVLVGYVRIQPIVATLIMMVAGRGLAQALADSSTIYFDRPAYVFFGSGYLLGLPFAVILVAIAFAVTALLTRKTALGMFVEAVGDNETASYFSGIGARKVKVFVYGFSGLCAGLAGLIAAAYVKEAEPFKGGMFTELDAIFAVVVGGTALTGGRFTLVGSIVGAILIETLNQTMLNQGVRPDVAPAFKAVVIVAVCLLQSAKFRGQLNAAFAWARRRLLGRKRATE